MGQLLTVGDDGPARCAICGAEAVGPCGSCHRPTCGDCCVLTEGGAKLWAVCLRCDKKGGRSLRSGWVLVLWWVAAPSLAIAALLAVLVALTRACR